MHVKSNKIISAIMRLALFMLATTAVFLKPAAAAIRSLPELIGNPIDVFNGLPESSQTTLIWFLGLLALTLIICVFIGISKNIIKTSVGGGTKDAKLSTGGILDNINILVVIIVGALVLGVGGALILGFSTPPNTTVELILPLL